MTTTFDTRSLMRRLPGAAAAGCLFVAISLLAACNKLVSISDPTDRITVQQAFSTDALATAAINGVYFSIMDQGHTTGSLAVDGGLSADELIDINASGDPAYLINTNHISIVTNGGTTGAPTDNLWPWAYGVI